VLRALWRRLWGLPRLPLGALGALVSERLIEGRGGKGSFGGDAEAEARQKRRDEELKKTAALAVAEEYSSEEEFELFFKEPRQLMDTLTELEEKNLFLIQSSQETEQMLDELQHTFEHTKREMGGKVTQLKENIRQLERNIAAEKRRCAELRASYAEKAGTGAQEEKLAELFHKISDVYVRCGLSTDHDPDTLQMLASIESKIEELISGLDDAYNQDSDLVMRLEWKKEKERWAVHLNVGVKNLLPKNLKYPKTVKQPRKSLPRLR